MKFLTVGQSFFAKKSEKSPYKVTKETLLPTFGGSKPLPGVEELQSDLPHAPAKVLTLKALDKPLFPAKPERKVPTAEPLLKNKSSGARSGGWFTFSWLNPFGRKKKSARRFIQAELLLGTVQPMRNDLSDADLEVVAAGKQATRKRLWLAESLLNPVRMEEIYDDPPRTGNKPQESGAKKRTGVRALIGK